MDEKVEVKASEKMKSYTSKASFLSVQSKEKTIIQPNVSLAKIASASTN
jgi:hypothetical protein